jgi:hypothetical protein
MEAAALALGFFGLSYYMLSEPAAPAAAKQPTLDVGNTVTNVRLRMGDAIGYGNEVGAEPMPENGDPVANAVAQLAPMAPLPPMPQFVQPCQTTDTGAPSCCQKTADAPIGLLSKADQQIAQSPGWLVKDPQTVTIGPAPKSYVPPDPLTAPVSQMKPVVDTQLEAQQWFASLR